MNPYSMKTRLSISQKSEEKSGFHIKVEIISDNPELKHLEFFQECSIQPIK